MLQIVAWYVSCWNIEVTFEAVRAHLGLETQRQWSTRAIARTTPCLLGLFSLVVLMAHALHPDHLPTRHAAWYPKAEPTFVDALAAMRRYLWEQRNSPAPPAPLGSLNSSEGILDTLIEIACYAAYIGQSRVVNTVGELLPGAQSELIFLAEMSLKNQFANGTTHIVTPT
jgi:hypothetical protein